VQCTGVPRRRGKGKPKKNQAKQVRRNKERRKERGRAKTNFGIRSSTTCAQCLERGFEGGELAVERGGRLEGMVELRVESEAPEKEKVEFTLQKLNLCCPAPC